MQNNNIPIQYDHLNILTDDVVVKPTPHHFITPYKRCPISRSLKKQRYLPTADVFYNQMLKAFDLYLFFYYLVMVPKQIKLRIIEYSLLFITTCTNLRQDTDEVADSDAILNQY